MSQAFQIHADDNVATLLADVAGGAAVRVLGATTGTILSHDVIALGHKLATRAIGQGEAVIKYGVPVGRATRAIAAGEWVHLHNVASEFDERSQTLDVETGAVTDTNYE